MFRNEVVGEGTPEYIKVVMLKGIFDMMMLYEGAIMSSVEEVRIFTVETVEDFYIPFPRRKKRLICSPTSWRIRIVAMRSKKSL